MVVLGGQVSDCRDILSGVSQGSVLGTLLFVTYRPINDTDESLNSYILKFADDTKIYSKVNSLDGAESLLADLRSLVSWSKDWQMFFNIEKCKEMPFGHNNSIVDYCMNSIQLQNVKEEKI